MGLDWMALGGFLFGIVIGVFAMWRKDNEEADKAYELGKMQGYFFGKHDAQKLREMR